MRLNITGHLCCIIVPFCRPTNQLSSAFVTETYVYRKLSYTSSNKYAYVTNFSKRPMEIIRLNRKDHGALLYSKHS